MFLERPRDFAEIEGYHLPRLSVIVPTRGRPAELRRFIESLEASTADLAGIEVIFVTDLDDESANDLPRTRFRVKHRRVGPKLTMGALNRAGYELAEETARRNHLKLPLLRNA